MSMDPTQSVQTYLTTAVESGFHGQPVEMLDEWQGRNNLLWRVDAGGREVVVKLFIDAGQVRSRRQFDGQDLFYRIGSAPRPLWYDWQPNDLTRPVLVYEWAPGEVVSPSDVASLQTFARLLAQVHSTDTDGMDRFSPHPVNLEVQWRLLSTSASNINVWLAQLGASELQERFRLLAEDVKGLVTQVEPLRQGQFPTPVHGDIRLENIIQAYGTVVFLDWELFGLGDPALEVAGFLHMNQAALSEEAREVWLDSYLSTVDQLGIEARIEVYRRMLPFQSTCFLLDGLRELAGDIDALAEYDENLPFLASTLTASLTQAARESGEDATDISEPVTKLFEQLSRGINSGTAG
jgi:hypothetical protein